MVRALRSNGSDLPIQTEDIRTIEQWDTQGESLLWVDICDPEPAEGSAEALHLLGHVFAFHPLAVEDALVADILPPPPLVRDTPT